MEFTVKNTELVKALNVVKGTFGSKSHPALNNIFIEASTTGEVQLKTSNGVEVSMTLFQAVVTTAGTVLVDGFSLSRIVSTFADGDIDIKQQPGTPHITITHSTGEIEIVGEDPQNFIQPLEIVETSGFMIPSKELKQGFESVAFARANGHTNTKLNGVAIVTENGRTSLYASDSTRVAKYIFDTPAAADINVVVGTEVIKGLNAIPGNIAVKLATNGIQFLTNESSYQSAVMATGFPPQVNNYFLLPSHASLIVDRDALKDVLQRVSILSKAGKDTSHAEFEFKDSGELEVKFRGTRGGLKSEKVPTTHTGPSVSIRLSVDKLLDSVSHVEKDRVEIHFPKGNSTQIKAVNIYPEGERDYGIFNMAVSS